MAADDVRYERDIYTWLTSLELSQYYFMFKGAGLEKIRDILYVDAADIRRIGVEDDRHVRKLMVGVRHVIVPDKLLLDGRTSPVWQSGRLIVDIYGWLDYTTLLQHVGVCRRFRDCLNKGVRRLTILSPAKHGIPVDFVMSQFSCLTELNGWKLGPEGAVGLSSGLQTLTKATEAGSELLKLDLESSRVKNKGIMAVAEAMAQGGMTRLQHLNLSTNNILHKGMVALSRTLTCKRHRGLKSLNLSYNGIGDPGMEGLSEAIAGGAMPALERLKLCSIGMSDAGFADLCEPLATRSLMRLVELDVRWNPKMKDRAGKRMLVVIAYQGTPNLQILNMRGHSMSHRTIKLLTAGCDGYFDLII